MLKYPIITLSLISFNYSLAADTSKTNMYQEVQVIDIYRQNKNILNKNWFFKKISSIKNQKDIGYLLEIIAVLKKESASIDSTATTLKGKFSQSPTENRDILKTDITALQQAFSNINYLKQLLKTLVAYCLKNSTETESAIDKLLQKEPEKQAPTDFSKLKTFFEDFIKEVEKVRS